MSQAPTKNGSIEAQIKEAIIEGDFDRLLALEKELDRILRIHDELEPLAAVALLRGDYQTFKRVIEYKAVNFLYDDWAKRILARHFGTDFATKLGL